MTNEEVEQVAKEDTRAEPLVGEIAEPTDEVLEESETEQTETDGTETEPEIEQTETAE